MAHHAVVRKTVRKVARKAARRKAPRHVRVGRALTRAVYSATMIPAVESVVDAMANPESGIKFVLGIAKRAGKRVSEVQSVIFDKLKWTTDAAHQWLKDHGFATPAADKAATFLRFRQQSPRKYKEFRTVVPGGRRNPRSYGGRMRGSSQLRGGGGEWAVSPGYQVRFIRPGQAGELMDLFHLARTALSGKDASNYNRMLWASNEFHKAHPEVSATAAYKDLDGLRSNWSGAKNPTTIKQLYVAQHRAEADGEAYTGKYPASSTTMARGFQKMLRDLRSELVDEKGKLIPRDKETYRQVYFQSFRQADYRSHKGMMAASSLRTPGAGASSNPSGMGIFKGLYRGQGIYWAQGAYNLDGSGYYKTIADARHAIDQMIEERGKGELAEARGKISGGAIRASREGDTITLHYPDGTQESMPIRQFRQRVFDIEDKWGAEVVHMNPDVADSISSYDEHLGITTRPEFQEATPDEQAAAMTAMDLCENPVPRMPSDDSPASIRRVMDLVKSTTSLQTLHDAWAWAGQWNAGGDVWLPGDRAAGKPGVIGVISARLAKNGKTFSDLLRFESSSPYYKRLKGEENPQATYKWEWFPLSDGWQYGVRNINLDLVHATPLWVVGAMMPSGNILSDNAYQEGRTGALLDAEEWAEKRRQEFSRKRRNPSDLSQYAFDDAKDFRLSGAYDATGVANARVAKYGFNRWYNNLAFGSGGKRPPYKARLLKAWMEGWAAGKRVERKGNPESSATDLFKRFHGRDPETVKTITTQEHEHEYLTELGKLLEVQVATLSGLQVTIRFDKDQVLLASSEDGKQLFIEGDVELDLAKMKMAGSKWERDLMTLGTLTQFTYRARKTHIDDKEVDYFHNTAEAGGPTQPLLLYEPRNHKLLVSGGNYVTTSRGVEN